MADASMPLWLTALISVTSLLVGSGGVATILKVRADKALGVAASETTEDDALTKRWEALADAQLKSLLEPLQAEMKTLRDGQATLQASLESRNRSYWSAIKHIRSLNAWIARQVYSNTLTSHEPLPEPPGDLLEDL